MLERDARTRKAECEGGGEQLVVDPSVNPGLRTRNRPLEQLKKSGLRVYDPVPCASALSIPRTPLVDTVHALLRGISLLDAPVLILETQRNAVSKDDDAAAVLGVSCRVEDICGLSMVLYSSASAGIGFSGFARECFLAATPGDRRPLLVDGI